MKVYVLYVDYGQYEGCSAPESVVLTLDDVQAWVDKNPEFNAVSEFEIEDCRTSSE